jgi:hypothetical protein
MPPHKPTNILFRNFDNNSKLSPLEPTTVNRKVYPERKMNQWLSGAFRGDGSRVRRYDLTGRMLFRRR